MRDDGYVAYEQQNFACPSMQQVLPMGYESASDQLSYTSNVYCHLDTVYGLPTAPISENKKDPLVTGFNPEEGRERTRVIVHIRSDYELVSAIKGASLSFATRDCPAQFTSISSSSRSAHLYAVTSEAPTFAATGSCSPHVLICVRLQNHAGMTVHAMDVGYFRYTSQYESGVTSTPKRAVAQQLSQDYPSGLCPIGTSPYPHRTRPPTHDTSPRYSPYELPQTSSRRRSSTFSSETTNSSMPSTPQDPGWASSYAASNGPGSLLNGSMALSPRFSLIPPTTIASSPGLIRTTELVKALKAKALKARSESGHTVSPGNGFLDPSSENSKHFAANLVIKPKLDSMTQDWTPEECKVKRRLVQFWRSQTGGTVNTSFAPVETCVRKSGTISCILWDKPNGCRQYVVTSVDIIHLLDFLVDCKTDTKEQNRIRRNVDKFDKQTIKKDCQETGTLFELVMGFPDPKPRHIAKAVKVFPWQNLTDALTKVIEKYVSFHLSRGLYCYLLSSLTKSLWSQSPDYWAAAAFIRDNPALMKTVNDSISKPKALLKSEQKQIDNDELDSHASFSPTTPDSTATSTPSRSHSSAYSASGPSCASSIPSPNLEHTFYASQFTNNTMVRHQHMMGPTSDPLPYASSTVYTPSRPDVLGPQPMAPVSMVPVRGGSWDFSGAALATTHPFYRAREE